MLLSAVSLALVLAAQIAKGQSQCPYFGTTPLSVDGTNNYVIDWFNDKLLFTYAINQCTATTLVSTLSWYKYSCSKNGDAWKVTKTQYSDPACSNTGVEEASWSTGESAQGERGYFVCEGEDNYVKVEVSPDSSCADPQTVYAGLGGCIFNAAPTKEVERGVTKKVVVFLKKNRFYCDNEQALVQLYARNYPTTTTSLATTEGATTEVVSPTEAISSTEAISPTEAISSTASAEASTTSARRLLIATTDVFTTDLIITGIDTTEAPETTEELQTTEVPETTEVETTEYETSEYETSEYETSEYETSEYETSEYETSEYETSEYETSEYETSEYETSEYETSEGPETTEESETSTEEPETSEKPATTPAPIPATTVAPEYCVDDLYCAAWKFETTCKKVTDFSVSDTQSIAVYGIVKKYIFFFFLKYSNMF
ncbi:Lysostaphin precursor, partial [Reticulomyxa filosa]